MTRITLDLDLYKDDKLNCAVIILDHVIKYGLRISKTGKFFLSDSREYDPSLLLIRHICSEFNGVDHLYEIKTGTVSGAVAFSNDGSQSIVKVVDGVYDVYENVINNRRFREIRSDPEWILTESILNDMNKTDIQSMVTARSYNDLDLFDGWYNLNKDPLINLILSYVGKGT